MTSRTRDACIGLATIVAIVATTWMLMSFGAFRAALQESYTATVRLDRAGGLRFGSQITLDGVPIGLIKTVNLQMDEALPVELNCAIDEWARIPVDHRVVVETGLIGGGTILAFRSETDEANRVVFAPDELPIFAGQYTDVGETISSLLDTRMGPVIDSFESFSQLAKTYNEVGDRVNAMLEGSSSSEESIVTAITRINGVLNDAQKALQLASSWLDDPQMQEDVRTAAFKANLLIERATDTIGKAGELAQVLQGEVTEVTSSLVSTADAIDKTLADIRGVLARATTGPGAISRLVNDPGLYDDLRDSIQRLEATLAAIELLVTTIEKEGVIVEF
jgi:ABC-type transporter Mla subunit MlaD